MTQPKTAYLAGPMRGVREFNFPAFRRATKILRDRGIDITSPHEMDEAAGFNWEGFSGTEDLAEYDFNIVERLCDDIAAVCDVDAVICLEGWTHSSGARAEASFAWAVGKDVYAFEEGNRTNGFTHSLARLFKGLLIPTGDINIIEWED